MWGSVRVNIVKNDPEKIFRDRFIVTVFFIPESNIRLRPQCHR